MGKRRFAALCLGVLLLLTGCGQREKKAVLPLSEALGAVLPDGGELVPIPEDGIYDLLGVSADLYTEAVYLVSADGMSAWEAVAVRAKDPSALDRAVSLLTAHLSQRMEETRTYLPEAYALLSAAKIQQKGLTAVLIVGEDAQAETAAFLSQE